MCNVVMFSGHVVVTTTGPLSFSTCTSTTTHGGAWRASRPVLVASRAALGPALHALALPLQAFGAFLRRRRWPRFAFGLFDGIPGHAKHSNTLTTVRIAIGLATGQARIEPG
eukprot:scaffold659_cov329-Prasinococcus_capsulatus_cf.AAC.35